MTEIEKIIEAEREAFLYKNLFTAIICLSVEFTQNSIPFFARQIFPILLSALGLYAIFVSIYENIYRL